MIRGGDWYSDGRDCRSAFRYADVPDGRFYALGMRVVCQLTSDGATPESTHTLFAATAKLTAADLTHHYTTGLDFFHGDFAPRLKHCLEQLTNNVWSLDDYIAFAAGSDVDFMAHLVEAIASSQRVVLYPGDWFGFQVGCTNRERIAWDSSGNGSLACLCIPSVRNGHVTETVLKVNRSPPSPSVSAKAAGLNFPAEAKRMWQNRTELIL